VKGWLLAGPIHSLFRMAMSLDGVLLSLF
jgi:hypothetical protein